MLISWVNLMLVTIQFRDEFKPDEKLLSAHYAEHIGKPFYKSLLAFISSAPVMAIVSLESSL